MTFYEYLGPETFFFASESEAEAEIEQLNHIHPPEESVALHELFCEVCLSNLDDVDVEDTEFWGETREETKDMMIKEYFRQNSDL